MKTFLEIIIAISAFGVLLLGVSKWRTRKKLEKQLYGSSLVLQSRVLKSRFSSSLVNQGHASVRLTAFTIFCDEEGYQPDDVQAWIQIITKIGLTSPSNLELDVHFFGLPQNILPQSEFYLIRAEFEQSNAEILTALRRLKVKLTTVSSLGISKTKVVEMVPNIQD